MCLKFLGSVGTNGPDVPAKFQPNCIQGKLSKLLEVFRRLPGPAETHEKRGGGYYLSGALTNVGVGDASMVNSSTLCVIGVGQKMGALSEGAAGRRARWRDGARRHVFDSARRRCVEREGRAKERNRKRKKKHQKKNYKKPKKKKKKKKKIKIKPLSKNKKKNTPTQPPHPPQKKILGVLQKKSSPKFGR